MEATGKTHIIYINPATRIRITIKTWPNDAEIIAKYIKK